MNQFIIPIEVKLTGCVIIEAESIPEALIDIYQNLKIGADIETRDLDARVLIPGYGEIAINTDDIIYRIN